MAQPTTLDNGTSAAPSTAPARPPSTAPFSPAAPGSPHPQSFEPIVPEPTMLTAVLDASGAPTVTQEPESDHRSVEHRRRRSDRIKIAVAVVVLTVGALAGPPFVRWIVDQVQGGTDPLAPQSPGVSQPLEHAAG